MTSTGVAAASTRRRRSGLIEASPLLTMDPANQGVSTTARNGDILGYEDLSAARALDRTATSRGVIHLFLTAVTSFQSTTPPTGIIHCPPTQAEANPGPNDRLHIKILRPQLGFLAVDGHPRLTAPPTRPSDDPLLAWAGGSGVSPGGARGPPRTLSVPQAGAGQIGAGTQGTDPDHGVTPPVGQSGLRGVLNNLGAPLFSVHPGAGRPLAAAAHRDGAAPQFGHG